MNPSNVIEIFIAYSRKDSDFLDDLKTFLWPLEKNNSIKVWYDGEIVAGQVWEAEIKQAIHASEIVLLLVSANSLASDYFYDKEVANALERHHKGECIVVPVVLKPCGWKETDLRLLQALPQNGKPITLWGNKDEAYESIYNGVKATIKRIRDKKEGSEMKKNDERLQQDGIVHQLSPELEESKGFKEQSDPKSPEEIKKGEQEKKVPKKWLVPGLIAGVLLLSAALFILTSSTKTGEGEDGWQRSSTDTGSTTETSMQDSLKKEVQIESATGNKQSVESKTQKGDNIAQTETSTSSKVENKKSSFEFASFPDALAFVLDEASNNFVGIRGESESKSKPLLYSTKVIVKGGFFQGPTDILFEEDQWVEKGKDQWVFRFMMIWDYTGNESYDQNYVKETFSKAEKIVDAVLMQRGIEFLKKYRQWRTPDPQGSLLFLFPPYRIEINQAIGNTRFVDEINICRIL